MKAVGVIPARYRAQRFEGKVLAPLGGRPVLQHVYEGARGAASLTDLLVATDDERVAAAVRAFGGNVVMTSPEHPSGTDRVAEAAAGLDAGVVVNIQGDEPFITGREIDELIEPYASTPDLLMSTLVRAIDDDEVWRDPNVVKAVVDRAGFALYFSRSPIPYRRREDGFRAWEHLGIYAYRKEFLLEFARMAPTALEYAEGLEQLRALEHGYRIRAVATRHHVGISIDTPQDLARAEQYLAETAARER